MKLVSISKTLGLVITLTLLASALAKSDKHHDKHTKDEVVKFVQGGAPAGGNGSRKHPYNSLQTAQTDASWNVLVVLSSAVALTDGIILSNRNLIGEENPTCITLSATQPTLSTLGVTVIGNATIENIYFLNSTTSAINYDQAENLRVKNVLISGSNSGNAGSVIGSAITGTCPNSGNTLLEHVIIRNNNNATPSLAGVRNSPTSGAQRKLLACDCEFNGLTNIGILTRPTGTNTTSSVVVKDCYFHDYITLQGVGIQCRTMQGATETISVKDSTFSNIVGNVFGGFHMFLNPTASPDLKVHVEKCSFQETTPNFSLQNVAVFIKNEGSSVETITENSVATNLTYFYDSQIVDAANTTSIIHNKLCGNTVTGQIFYRAENVSTPPQGSPLPVEITDITRNTFNGAEAIQITTTEPYALLEIISEHNCFTGTGMGSIGFHTTSNFNIGNAVIIKAHCNSISNFATDINDAGSNVNYLVSRNFWGQPTTSCSSSTPCPGTYQICQNGMCLGPTTSLGTTGHPFTGYVDASDPLAQSIKCPKGCC